jgi:hypothetical protein
MPMTASAALRTTAAAAALATVALAAALPGHPSAASTPGGFSERQSPDRYRFGDCRILLGPAYDAARAGRRDWRAFGAGRVDCARRHGRIAIAVAEMRWTRDRGVTVAGAPVRRTATGSTTGIVRTGAACGEGPASRWQTRVSVTVDGWSTGWIAGRWSGARADGCRAA